MWESSLVILGHIALWFVMVMSVLLIVIGLPGTFVIIGAVFVYSLVVGFSVVPISFLVILLCLAIVGEVFESLFGAVSAKKYGGSNAAIWGTIIGSILGAVWGSALAPIIGTLLGAFAGAFFGAFVAEYLGRRDARKAARVGYGAFLGTLGGKLTKIVIAICMIILTAIKIY